MEYQKYVKNKTVCLICPRECALDDGAAGFCGVRKNEGGKIISTTYGYNTGLAIDPVEKKPLYHFYPSSAVLSFGTLGCSMGCKFCQNHHMTKIKEDPKKFNKTSPDEVLQIALQYNVKSVAFTYNDPIVFFEYAIDCAKLLKEAGIETIAVTSGFMNIEPAKEFYKYMSAANIDIKGFTEKFYGKYCFAKLQPVLDLIKYVKNETNCHIELTTLLIEGANTNSDEIKNEAEWILKNLDSDVPLHFSAFTPKYKMTDKEKTSFATLLNARKIALDCGLNYVYTGNLATVETSTTYCKSCKKPVIERNGWQILNYNVKDGGKCAFCGGIINGRF